MVHGTIILRIGLAAVFAFFCVTQLLDPQPYTGYLPLSLQRMANPTFFIYANAVLDGLLAIAIGFSILTRVAPLIGFVHLLSIAVSMGLNDVAVRDFGLALACLSLVFIHEEHIPWAQKQVLSRFFGKKH